MRAMIFEQWHGGHYYNYMECLAKRLSSIATEVVIATPEKGIRSRHFAKTFSHLSEQNNVKFDLSVPPLPDELSNGHSVSVSKHAKEAILRNKPDYVFLTTADDQLIALPFLLLSGKQYLLRNTHIEAIVHHKTFRGGLTSIGRVASLIRLASMRTGVYRQLNLVNYLLYGIRREPVSWWHSIARVAGDPVPLGQKRVKSEARRSLGLDTDGRYIGMVGGLGGQKAVIETVAAFSRAKLRKNDRMLLAGAVSEKLAKNISTAFADLLNTGRLILLNQYLSDEELWTAFSALDLHCSVYNNFYGLSSLMLKSIAVDVPVVATDYGWTGQVAKRFGVGWTVRPHDLVDFSKVLPVALDQSGTYRRTVATERLLQFHAVDNFTAGVVQRAAALTGNSLQTPPLTWSWVVDALEQPL